MSRKSKVNVVAFAKGSSNQQAAVSQMGYSDLRPGQQEPIDFIMCERDTICILPTGGGKCLAPDTLVLRYDGERVRADSIVVGDVLLGPNSEPRRVLNTTTGVGPMYKITPTRGMSWYCNDAHILTVAIKSTNLFCRWLNRVVCNEVFDIPVKALLKESTTLQARVSIVRRPTEFPGAVVCCTDVEKAYQSGNKYTPKAITYVKKHTLEVSAISKEYTLAPIHVRRYYLAGLLDHLSYTIGTGVVVLDLNISSAKALCFLAQSLGMHASYRATDTASGVAVALNGGMLHQLPSRTSDAENNAYYKDQDSAPRAGIAGYNSSIKITSAGRGKYAGFQVDGDGRFLLGDCSVTHNSAIFAIPTIAMEWKTIVFSPLIALMRDQVQAMNRAGIRTGCINSSQSDVENYQILREWADDKLQMLYVAPERIANDQFKLALQSVRPQFVVVDEAHTISAWSKDFRPAYMQIGSFVKDHNPDVVAAFTATATDRVVTDICDVLGLTDPCIHRHYPARTNLKLSSVKIEKGGDIKSAVLNTVQQVTGSCLVYCQTVKEVEEMTSYLGGAGESVTLYHGQLKGSHDKSLNQDEFMSGRARICVATNAFGMGIDKADIECLIHTGPPGSIEAVAQETGRAARDGRDAICRMFYSPSGLWMQEFLFNSGNPDGASIRDGYNYLNKICDMDGVAHVTGNTLGDKIGSTAGNGVLNYLAAVGCVDRYSSPIKLYKFVVFNGKDLGAMSPSLKACYNHIVEGGTPIARTADGTASTLDIEYLISKLEVQKPTVDKKIRQLVKDGYLSYEPPFAGKSTRLVRPPTDEDIIQADSARMEAWKSITDVRTYLDCADSKKHAYLQKYFELSK